MNQKSILSVLFVLLSVRFMSAQFIVRDDVFSVTGLSNEGLVSGYSLQAGPYSIWNPDSATIHDIGGIAPGNGVGGQARFNTSGNLLCGTSMGSNGAEMSSYNRISGQWTPLGSLGFQIDGNVSGGFAISGDGNTVAGLSWADTAGGLVYSHAVAWNASEGLIDLRGMFSTIGRSTRANAVSHDGSVIVGWQDFNGPWKASVWRKNPAGGYYPNQYILIDTAGNQFDEFNQMGECSAISADGNWIGGYGDYANSNQPWIWSRDSGVINLGSLPNTGNGYVSSMTADGSTVVGWFDGQLFGDPLTPFIWTRTGGLQELNNYIHTVLGDSTDTHQVYTADCISPDGHYIAGYGVDNNTFSLFAYRVSLTTTTAVDKIQQTSKVRVYPNPTASRITIETLGKAWLYITAMDGRIVYQKEINQTQVIDMSAWSSGVYSLFLQAGSEIQTQKVIKN